MALIKQWRGEQLQAQLATRVPVNWHAVWRMLATLCRSTPFRGTTNTIICCVWRASRSIKNRVKRGTRHYQHRLMRAHPDLLAYSRESQMGSKRRQSRKHGDEREELVSVCNWYAYERAVKIKLCTRWGIRTSGRSETISRDSVKEVHLLWSRLLRFLLCFV